jgi:hypothetical protein
MRTRGEHALSDLRRSPGEVDDIDQVAWAERFMFDSFGVRIGIRVSQPNLMQSLRKVLPPGRAATASRPAHRLFSLIVDKPEESGHRFNLLYEDHERLARQRELAPVLKLLEVKIRRAVAEMAPRRVFVHAGVVAHRGRAIVIPGRTMSGKSTLVSELIRKGASYFSDEYAVLDEKGLMHPFAKPVSLREAGPYYDAIDYAAEHFGATIGVKPVPVGLVIITHYFAGAQWQPRTVSRGQGALALLSHCIAARRQPRRVMSTLRRALAEAVILKGSRGEAAELAEHLLERLSTGDHKHALIVKNQMNDYKR